MRILDDSNCAEDLVITPTVVTSPNADSNGFIGRSASEVCSPKNAEAWCLKHQCCEWTDDTGCTGASDVACASYEETIITVNGEDVYLYSVAFDNPITITWGTSASSLTENNCELED